MFPDSRAIELKGLLLGTKTFILADIAPSGFDAGYITLVDSLGVSFTQLEQGLTSDISTVERLGLDSLENFGAQVLHLSDELGPHLRIGQVLQLLEVTLVLRRPHHRVAVSVFKERSDHTPDAVFVLYCVRVASLLPQGLLEVLFRIDLVAICVQEAQSEVTDDPHEGREELCELIRVLFRRHLTHSRCACPAVPDLNRLRQIDDEGEVLKGLLVDCSHGVIHEVRTDEQG